MRHWSEEGATELERELLEILREEALEPPEGAQNQVFAALSAELGLGAASNLASGGASKALSGGSAKGAAATQAGVATAGAGSGVVKLAIVGLLLGGATAGVGHYAVSGSGGEERSTVATIPSAAPQILPRGNERSAGEVEAPESPRAAPVAPVPPRSGQAASIHAEVDSPPGPPPGSSVARFGSASSPEVMSPEGRAAARASQLEAERKGLAEARQALHGGNAARALGLLTQLNQRFPQLLLAQEHEALSIRALAASGARAQARARAERFVALYPTSPLTPGVQEILR